ncbi:MAG: hypothetical protein QNJ98_15030 [Planctomycetota bacterium]|nr:hypothetical protein [Planctomycetota bacterium]
MPALFRAPSTLLAAGGALLLVGAALPLAGCGDDGPHPIDDVRKVSKVDPRELLERSHDERFARAFPGGQRTTPPPGMGSGSPKPAPAGWTWTTPEGWKARPKSGMREVSIEVPGEPPADLAVFVLPPSGMLDNVNRWRRQMGLGQVAEAALAGMAYEHRGEKAILVDLRGAYEGSGRKDRFLGLLKMHAGRLLSVKFVGPEDLVTANEQKFHAFLKSLAPQSGGASPHGGSPHGGSAHGGGAPGTPPVGDEGGLKGRLTWDTPAGWASIASASGQRIATFRIDGAPDIEVRINSLKGDGGGLQMIGRMWANMAGQTPPTEEELAALETISVLGREAVIFEFAGKRPVERGGEPVDVLLLGLMCTLDSETLFVRIIGEASAVAPQKAAFLSLCKSLRMKE